MHVSLDLGARFGPGNVLEEGADAAGAGDMLSVSVGVGVRQGLNLGVDFRKCVRAAAPGVAATVDAQGEGAACHEGDGRDQRKEEHGCVDGLKIWVVWMNFGQW